MSIETSASLFDPGISPELRAIYEQIIKEGNPKSGPYKKESSYVEPSFYDQFISVYGRESQINFVPIYNQFGGDIVNIVDIAQKVYTSIKELTVKTATEELTDTDQGMLQAQNEYFNGLVNIASNQIDIPALLQRNEEVQTELLAQPYK